jgi:phosphoheptose isomerase
MADLPFELVITNFSSVIIAAQAKHSETKTIAVSGTLIEGEKMKGCSPDITLAVPFTNEKLIEAVADCLGEKLP